MDDLTSEIKETVAGDGVKLRYREWEPKTPKGVLIGVHGIRSHGAWYNDSCAYLCSKGYRVLFPDRRGSGLNRGETKPVSYRRWIEDLEHFVDVGGRGLPGRPVHLLGISWGGRLAAAVAASKRVRLRSVIFSAPGLVALRDYGFFMKLSVAAALLLKKKKKEFVIPLSDPALFTDDPDEQSYIEEDAFGLRTATARFLYESRRLERYAGSAFAGIRIPLLLLLAGRDQIVDNAAVERLYSSCASGDKAMKVYEQARHTLEFDRCRQEYFDDLVKWLDAHGRC